MRSIILEGPNGSGKSTLAGELELELDRPFYHATRPTDSNQAIHLANAQLENILMNKPAIYDRSHALSRIVYQHKTIGAVEYDLLYAHVRFLQHHCTIIYCTGQGEHDTNKPHYNDRLIKEVQEAKSGIDDAYYEHFIALKHIAYNFEKDSFKGLLLKLDAV